MLPDSTIQAVVFDLDGLMFNTEQLYDQVGNTLLQSRGHQFSSELKDAMTGRPAPIALQIMIDHHRLDATVDQLRAETDAIFPEILRRSLAPMPGLLKLLNALKIAARPLAIATSSRRDYVTSILTPMNLESRFEFVLTSEDVQRGKPDPEIYQIAARCLGLATTQIAVLEDSEIGCRAAVAAGALTIAVPGEHSRHHDFSGVSLIATSLEDRRLWDLIGLSI